jgi:2-polyprenyl-3-methyl-5-hydroxy-6-metoxy-1,4-benzoquinol methylase
MIIPTEFNSNFSKRTYADVENRLAECSDHIKSLINYTKNIFDLQNCEKKSFLDIGSGPGFIARALNEFFGEVTVVDPNSDYISNYEELSKNSKFQYIIGNFQDIEFNKKYNNILCSHMLYHVPKNEWKCLLLKMKQLLELDGSALILLVSPQGSFHELCTKINANFSHSGVLCATLKDAKIEHSVEYEKNIYTETNRKNFSDLVHIFAIDDCYLPEEYKNLSIAKKLEIENLIESYINSCFIHEKGTYESTIYSAMVLISS